MSAASEPPKSDPFARQLEQQSTPSQPVTRRRALAAAAVFLALALTFVLARWTVSEPPTSSTVTQRPTPTLLVAMKDLARLETTELHIEKVIDLTDRQSRLFGLIEATDAILLVAVGQVTVGVDLGKLADGDVSLDPSTGTARLRLPEPEVLSTRLDENKTYVYTRQTGALARRNEELETRARREAAAAIERAARESEALKKAKNQADKTLTTLAMQLGAKRVEITWRPSGPTAP